MKGSGQKCARCGEEKPCDLQPTLNQLIFGGFRSHGMEYRCAVCEKKVAAIIKRMIEQPGGFSRR